MKPLSIRIGLACALFAAFLTMVPPLRLTLRTPSHRHRRASASAVYRAAALGAP